MKNARREVDDDHVARRSPGRRRRAIEAGRGTVTWVPSAPGRVRVRVAVEGMDGSRSAGSTAFRVLSPPPAIRLTERTDAAPSSAGRVRFSFQVADALDELAEVSTRDGTFTRRYRLRNGTGFVEWTPTTAGPAVLRVRARGRQGQTASDTARLTVAPGRSHGRSDGDAPPACRIARPSGAKPRSPSASTGSRVVVARIAGDGGEARVWRFARPAGRVAFAWTPTRPGSYRLTVSARSSGGTMTQTAIQLTVERAR